MATAGRYVPTDREKAFQSTIENPKYERDIIIGLKPFFEDKAPDAIKGFYSKDELAALLKLKGTERDVEESHAGKDDPPLFRDGTSTAYRCKISSRPTRTKH